MRRAIATQSSSASAAPSAIASAQSTAPHLTLPVVLWLTINHCPGTLHPHDHASPPHPAHLQPLNARGCQCDLIAPAKTSAATALHRCLNQRGRLSLVQLLSPALARPTCRRPTPSSNLASSRSPTTYQPWVGTPIDAGAGRLIRPPEMHEAASYKETTQEPPPTPSLIIIITRPLGGMPGAVGRLSCPYRPPLQRQPLPILPVRRRRGVIGQEGETSSTKQRFRGRLT